MLELITQVFADPEKLDQATLKTVLEGLVNDIKQATHHTNQVDVKLVSKMMLFDK